MRAARRFFVLSIAAAGASQPHKHLQLIPFTSLPGTRVPIEPLLRAVTMTGVTGTVPGLSFLHAYAPMDPAWLESRQDGARSLLACYRWLLQAVALPVTLNAAGRSTAPPYNLLATRQWMLVVPRSRECFEGISINALGFAGALLVRDAAQLEVLRARGPLTALRHVTSPPHASPEPTGGTS